MFQCTEGAQRVLHLGVLGTPVDFGVVEIVEYLVAARLLSDVDERHSVECANKRGQRIAVIAIELG